MLLVWVSRVTLVTVCHQKVVELYFNPLVYSFSRWPWSSIAGVEVDRILDYSAYVCNTPVVPRILVTSDKEWSLVLYLFWPLDLARVPYCLGIYTPILVWLIWSTPGLASSMNNCGDRALGIIETLLLCGSLSNVFLPRENIADVDS